jgi:hypothetical protein
LNMKIKKEIYIPNRLLNFVLKWFGFLFSVQNKEIKKND